MSNDIKVRFRFFATIAAVALWCAVACAQSTPRVIPRIAEVKKPVGDVAGALKQYFSNGRLNFQVSNQSQTGSEADFSAKREGIDSATWAKWASCKVDPMHLLYSLEGADVTVNVKVKQVGNDSSWVTVTADFQGNYGLGGDHVAVPCVSSGALENEILAAAGASLSAAQQS